MFVMLARVHQSTTRKVIGDNDVNNNSTNTNDGDDVDANDIAHATDGNDRAPQAPVLITVRCYWGKVAPTRLLIMIVVVSITCILGGSWVVISGVINRVN